MSIRILVIILALSFSAHGQQSSGPNKLYPILYNYARDLYAEYSNIPYEKKIILEEIATYLIGNRQLERPGRILFVETNHTARAVLAHVWAKTAAYYYGIEDIEIYSGGIETSRISTNTILALENAGFIVYKTGPKINPAYEIKYSFNVQPILLKSMKYNDPSYPKNYFGSVLLCSNADVNLPVIKGNDFRTSLHYFDPIAFDGNPDELDLYVERSKEIALDMFYIFYVIKNAN